VYQVLSKDIVELEIVPYLPATIITYSPENIEERLKIIEHFRERTEKK